MRVKKQYKKDGKVKAVKAPPTDPPRDESKPITPMEKLSVFSLKTDEDGNVVDIETRFDSHDPIKFYGKWADSPMYKKMMEGKEGNFNTRKYHSPYMYETVDSNRKFHTDLDYRRKSMEGETPNHISSSEEFRNYLKGRGIDGETVTDLRQRNLSNAKFSPITEKDNKNYGYVIPGKPFVNFSAEKSRDDQDVIKVHELSHMQDIHILDLDDLDQSITNLDPGYTSDEPWYPEDHISQRRYYEGTNSPLMPYEDYKKIIDYSDRNFRENYKGNYYKGNYGDKNRARAEYVTQPTETRARLNTTRFEVNKLFPGLWDPFNEEMTPEVLNKLKEKVESTPELDSEGNRNLELHNLRQLLDYYTDEQIIDMFNSIAMDEDRSEGRTFSFA